MTARMDVLDASIREDVLKSLRQGLATRCCDCGRENPVVPQPGGYEFEWRCPCGNAGVISWRHDADPPRFMERQMELFHADHRQH